MSNNLIEYINNSEIEKYVHPEYNKIVIYKHTNSFFNTNYYFHNNKIFSRKTWIYNEYKGIDKDFISIDELENYKFPSDHIDPTKIKNLFPITEFESISENLYIPNICVYWNYWHFMIDELPKFYMFFELKKYIPDLKIVIDLNNKGPKGLKKWHEELFFDILELKKEDIFIPKKLTCNKKLTFISKYLNNNVIDEYIYREFYQKKILNKVCMVN